MSRTKWTLGDIRRQQHFLFAGCPKGTAIALLDLDELIRKHGADFNILGPQLEETLACPCGSAEHWPKVVVGTEKDVPERERLAARAAPPPPPAAIVPFDEAVASALRLRVEWRKDPIEQAREQQLQQELEKIRERKRRRRERNPYDFS